MIKHSSDIYFRNNLPDIRYRKIHAIKEISEATIMHYLEKTVMFEIQVSQKIAAYDELTSRSSFTGNSNLKGSFAMQLEGSTAQEI